MQPGLSDTVAVEVDGMFAWWCEGTFGGAREIVRTAEQAAAVGYVVTWGSSPRSWCAGCDTPQEALAALHVYARDRTIITRWPDSLFEWWREEFVDCCVDGGRHAGSP